MGGVQPQPTKGGQLRNLSHPGPGKPRRPWPWLAGEPGTQWGADVQAQLHYGQRVSPGFSPNCSSLWPEGSVYHSRGLSVQGNGRSRMCRRALGFVLSLEPGTKISVSLVGLLGSKQQALCSSMPLSNPREVPGCTWHLCVYPSGWPLPISSCGIALCPPVATPSDSSALPAEPDFLPRDSVCFSPLLLTLASLLSVPASHFLFRLDNPEVTQDLAQMHCFTHLFILKLI